MSLIQSTGRHIVTASATTFGSTDSGKDFVQITCTNEAGEVITGWLYLTEAALASSVKQLREAFGFDGQFATLVEQVDGKQCAVEVVSENYNGKDRMKVKWFNSATGGGAPVAKPMANQAARLAALTAAAGRIPSATPKPAAARPPAAAPAPKPAPAAATVTEDAPF
jgi:hypothetical protein